MYSITNEPPVRDLAQNPKPTPATTRALAALLVLAAAFGFATAATAQSASYYHVQLRPGWNAIANQLNTGSNSLGDVLPWVPPGSVFSQWNADGQTDGTSTFDPEFGGWDNPSLTLKPGEGGFLMNPTPLPVTVAFVGELVEPHLPLSLPSNRPVLVARQIPAPATYEDITGLPPAEGTKLYRYSSTLQSDPANLATWRAYTFSQGLWTPGTPRISVGEPVFIQIAETQIVNNPPLLAPIAPLFVHQGEQGQRVVAASDPDGNRLTYSVHAGGGPGVRIDPATGELTFDSLAAPALGTNLVTVDVKDDGMPSLHAQQAVQIVVGPPVRIESLTLANGDTMVTWNSLPGREYFVRSTHDLTHPVWDYRGSVVALEGSASWTESVDTESPGGTFYLISTGCGTCDCDTMTFHHVRDNQDKKASITYSFDKLNHPEKATVEVPLRVYVDIHCADSTGNCTGHLKISATAKWRIIDANGVMVGGAAVNDLDAGTVTAKGGEDVTGTCGSENPERQSPEVKLKTSIDVSGRSARDRLTANPATAFLRVEFTVKIKTGCDGNGVEKTVTVVVDGRADNPAAGIKGGFDREGSDLDADGKKGAAEPGASADDRHKNDMDPDK